MPYYDNRKVHGRLEKVTPVELRREPDNRYDRYAIEVWAEEVKLGYLPRAENKTLVKMLDPGVQFTIQIRYVDPDVFNTYDGVYVKVYGDLEKPDRITRPEPRVKKKENEV